MELNYFYTHAYFIPAIAFLMTVIVKGICIKLSTGKVNISASFGSGGMPSAHSAVIASLAMAMAIKYGVNSDLFAITITLMVIIIYDAVNVRYEAGRHGKALNKMLDNKKFKEVLGHLPSEAFAGAVLGIIVAVVLYFL